MQLSRATWLAIRDKVHRIGAWIVRTMIVAVLSGMSADSQEPGGRVL
jgi:hypothetical protein